GGERCGDTKGGGRRTKDEGRTLRCLGTFVLRPSSFVLRIRYLHRRRDGADPACRSTTIAGGVVRGGSLGLRRRRGGRIHRRTLPDREPRGVERPRPVARIAR